MNLEIPNPFSDAWMGRGRFNYNHKHSKAMANAVFIKWIVLSMNQKPHGQKPNQLQVINQGEA